MTKSELQLRAQRFFGLYMVLARSLGMYCTARRTMGKIGICTSYGEILDTVLDRPGWSFRWFHKARLALHADGAQDPNIAWFFELPELRALSRLRRYDDVIARAPHCLECVRASFAEPTVQEAEVVGMMAAALLGAGRVAEARDLLGTALTRLESVEPGARAQVLLYLAEAEIRAGTSGGATAGVREAFARIEEAERALAASKGKDAALPIRLKAIRALACITGGRTDEGHALQAEASAEARNVLGTEHPLTKMLDGMVNRSS